jgi:hypothetical protein
MLALKMKRLVRAPDTKRRSKTALSDPIRGIA